MIWDTCWPRFRNPETKPSAFETNLKIIQSHLLSSLIANEVYGLIAKKENDSFLRKTVDYSGYILSKKRLKPSTRR